MLVHDTDIWLLCGGEGERRELPIVRVQRVPIRALPKHNKRAMCGSRGGRRRARACARVCLHAGPAPWGAGRGERTEAGAGCAGLGSEFGFLWLLSSPLAHRVPRAQSSTQTAFTFPAPPLTGDAGLEAGK